MSNLNSAEQVKRFALETVEHSELHTVQSTVHNIYTEIEHLTCMIVELIFENRGHVKKVGDPSRNDILDLLLSSCVRTSVAPRVF